MLGILGAFRVNDLIVFQKKKKGATEKKQTDKETRSQIRLSTDSHHSFTFYTNPQQSCFCCCSAR